MGVVKQFLGAVVATVAVMLLVAVVMAVTEPTAGASVPTVACGDTPGFCPNPPDGGYADAGDISREGYPAWNSGHGW